jgi:L-amino acid N-acyltransferase YncA
VKIRPATEADRDAIWNIFHEIVAVGDTYALDPGMSREAALACWFEAGTETYVAENDKRVKRRDDKMCIGVERATQRST